MIRPEIWSTLVSIQRTGQMGTTCESRIEKYASVQKLWTKQISYEKVAKKGRFALYFSPKLKISGCSYGCQKHSFLFDILSAGP